MNYFVQLYQPPFGQMSPPQLPGTASRNLAPSPAPNCGEHSREVLRSFGFEDAAIARLIESNRQLSFGQRPNPRRRKRHIELFYAKRAQRVEHRV